MVITHCGERYHIKAVQTTICPAGTAYWLIQAHHIADSRYNEVTRRVEGQESEMAIATIDTGAIYGSPTLANYIDRINTAIDEFWAKVK